VNAAELTAWGLIFLSPGLFAYAYVGYPLLLRIATRNRPNALSRTALSQDNEDLWPTVSISLPAFNEESRLSDTLESLLALDYPADRIEIVVISDASTDRTDEIAESYADHGIRLMRLPERGGKVAAENFGANELGGEIVVNTDATIRIPPDSLKPLIRVFQDTSIGVASGRDISVAAVRDESNQAESGYVGYEMGVRDLETRAGGIVGASGCFYAIRRELHTPPFPPHLSRDFASCLTAQEHGFRSVSVNDAVCYVPRTASLGSEYRRKVRTMARGLATLNYKRHLLNPLRHGAFAWKLFSHKLARWLVPLASPLAFVGLAMLAVDPGGAGARIALATGIVAVAAGWGAMRWAVSGRAPGPIASLGYVFSANLAGLAAWGSFLRGTRSAVWEPTRRG
jgi:cellulose synthase/poly-beta-1,6-N-acetylglucosamine synthase-like glycosyltransferase